MASDNAALALYQTIASAGTVETATINSDFTIVEVVNWHTTGSLYFTVDGVGGPASDGVPTVGGKNCYRVDAGQAFKVPSRVAGSTTVKLISSTAGLAYSVTGIADL